MLYLHLIWRQTLLVASHLAVIGRIAWSYIKSHRVISAIAAVVLIGVLVALSYFFGGAGASTTVTGNRAVTLLRVGDAAGAAPLSLIGSVRATREANVAPDTSGAVSAIYRNLGDYVAAGTVIAELKNETQRAQVAQARAALQKTESAVQVGGIGVGNAESSYAAAQESARAAISSAYATINDAVSRKIDQVFSNPSGNQPKFKTASASSQTVIDAETGRISINPILSRHAVSSPAGMNTDALLAELDRLAKETLQVQTLAQDVVEALNGAISNPTVSEATIAGYRADASLALSTVNGLSGTLSATAEGLRAKRSAVAIANESLATGNTGESADIAAAEANLAIALSVLEKTLIRAPIAGTINRLDLEVGSFVNASQPVIYITNPGGLEAVAYVSGNDLKDVVVGAKTVVAGNVEGTIVRIAGALDPVTKKAEVRVSLPPSAPLVAGQSATLAIERRVRTQTESAEISIPLSAIKITPEGPLVFTVNDASELVGNPVTLGALRGEMVTVTAGITQESVIVEDARGLKVGQKVMVEL